MDKFQNVCPNCGGSNDIIKKSCSFCKTLLNPTAIDLITTEELIEKTQEWINRLTSNVLVDDPNSRGWQKILYGSKKRLKLTELSGMIDDYIQVIKERNQISGVYTERIQYLEKKKSKNKFASQQNESKNNAIEHLPLVIGSLILFFVLSFLQRCTS
jgi:hypothetical protein